MTHIIYAVVAAASCLAAFGLGALAAHLRKPRFSCRCPYLRQFCGEECRTAPSAKTKGRRRNGAFEAGAGARRREAADVEAPARHGKLSDMAVSGLEETLRQFEALLAYDGNTAARAAAGAEVGSGTDPRGGEPSGATADADIHSNSRHDGISDTVSNGLEKTLRQFEALLAYDGSATAGAVTGSAVDAEAVADTDARSGGPVGGIADAGMGLDSQGGEPYGEAADEGAEAYSQAYEGAYPMTHYNGTGTKEKAFAHDFCGEEDNDEDKEKGEENA